MNIWFNFSLQKIYRNCGPIILHMEEGSPTKKDEIIMGESVSTIQYGYITVEHATEELLFEDIWRFFLGKEQIIREDKMVVEYRETASIYDVDSIVCDTISVCDVKVFDQILPHIFTTRMEKIEGFTM